MQNRLVNSQKEYHHIQYNGDNINDVAEFISQHGKPMHDVIAENYLKKKHIMCAIACSEAIEENPQVGEYYVIHPKGAVYLYTKIEFEGRFG